MNTNNTKRGNFEACYSFMDFVKATGLKPSIVKKAYIDFHTFTLNYIKSAGSGAITEAFELWSKKTSFLDTSVISVETLPDGRWIFNHLSYYNTPDVHRIPSVDADKNIHYA